MSVPGGTELTLAITLPSPLSHLTQAIHRPDPATSDPFTPETGTSSENNLDYHFQNLAQFKFGEPFSVRPYFVKGDHGHWGHLV